MDGSVKRRNKRGLFNFIGDIASGLFGVATEADLEKIYAHMNEIYRSVGHNALTVSQIKRELQVLAKNLDSKIQAITTTLDDTVFLVSNIAMKMMSIERNFEEQNRAFNFSIPVLFHTLQKKQALSDWIDGIRVLKLHRLPRYLVSFKTLKRALVQLADSVELHDPRLYLPLEDENILRIYDMQSSDAMFMGNDLYIITKEPFVYKHKLNVFHIQFTGMKIMFIPS